MPTYEFRCPAGHTFEQFHRISDAPSVAACPTCGEEAARAISGGAGLVFKGSGFYLTDYGKNAHRTSGPSSAGGESKGGEAKGSESKASEGGSKSESSSSSGSSSGGSSASGSSTSGASGSSSGGSSSASKDAA